MVNNTVVVYIRIGSSRDAIARAASYFHSASTPEDMELELEIAREEKIASVKIMVSVQRHLCFMQCN